MAGVSGDSALDPFDRALRKLDRIDPGRTLIDDPSPAPWRNDQIDKAHLLAIRPTSRHERINRLSSPLTKSRSADSYLLWSFGVIRRGVRTPIGALSL
jgi:hypothetical protein